MDYEAAVRAGEALVVGYLLIACAQGACPPTHFGKGQLQPACDGLGVCFFVLKGLGLVYHNE